MIPWLRRNTLCRLNREVSIIRSKRSLRHRILVSLFGRAMYLIAVKHLYRAYETGSIESKHLHDLAYFLALDLNPGSMPAPKDVFPSHSRPADCA